MTQIRVTTDQVSINLRTTPEERARLTAAAHAEGIPRQTWLHRVIVQAADRVLGVEEKGRTSKR